MGAPPDKRQSAYRAGLVAETLGAWILRLKGYRVLERRFKCPQGEIDLIVKRGNQLVFVEVKHRRDLSEAAYAISEHQKRRIHKAAESYLTRSSSPVNLRLRFDALLVAPPFCFRQIEDAWNI